MPQCVYCALLRGAGPSKAGFPGETLETEAACHRDTVRSPHVGRSKKGRPSGESLEPEAHDAAAHDDALERLDVDDHRAGAVAAHRELLHNAVRGRTDSCAQLLGPAAGGRAPA